MENIVVPTDAILIPVTQDLCMSVGALTPRQHHWHINVHDVKISTHIKTVKVGMGMG